MKSKQECTTYKALSKIIEENTKNKQNKWHLNPSERAVILFIGDVLFLLLSILISVFLWKLYHEWTIKNNDITIRIGLQQLWLLFPWLIISLIIDTYSFRNMQNMMTAIIQPAKTALLVSIFYLILYFFAPIGSIPRLMFLFFGLLSCCFLIFWRLCYFCIFSHKKFQEHLLLIGHSALFDQVLQIIQENNLYYKVIGTLPNCSMHGKVIPECENCTIPDNILNNTESIDKIVFSIDNPISQDFLNFILTFCEKGIPIIPMPLFYEQVLQRTPVQNMQGWYLNYLPLNEIPSGFIYHALKRILDIIFSIIGLFLFGLIFLPLALLVKISSPGPLFFSQMRVGKYGRPFRLWKLRTMYINSDKHDMWTLDNDTRITKLGRILRKLHLDELPQLWNVLKGDLSIVGIRPLSVEQCDTFDDLIPFHNVRHVAKPGITGWAIVNYKHVNDLEGAKIRLEYDIYYIKYRSFLLDCWIILRTIWIIITLKGL